MHKIYYSVSMKTELERFKDFSAPVHILRIYFPSVEEGAGEKKRLAVTPNIRERFKKALLRSF